MLSFILLSVATMTVLLSAIMLSVIMLQVVAPCVLWSQVYYLKSVLQNIFLL